MKKLLLNLFDLQTLNQVIDFAFKCYNQLLHFN